MKSARGPVTYLRNCFRDAVINVAGSSQVGNILYAGQAAFSEAVRKKFSETVAADDCGIVIENVALNRIYPPEKTKAAFDEVTAAGNTRSALRNEAAAYRVEVENEARSTAAAILADAETYKMRMIARSEAEKTYFLRILEQYRRSPDTVPMALYTDMLNDIAGALQGDKFLLGTRGKSKQLWMKLNPELKKSAAAGAGDGEGK
jgi:membrane protease subunit HflK